LGQTNGTVISYLHGGKNFGAGRGARQTHVQTAAESAGSVRSVLHAEVVAGDVRGAGVQLVQVELGEEAASQQQAGAVGGGVVGQAHLHAVPGRENRN
jgi:hypothetical protein